MAEIYELANEPLLLAPGVVHVWRTTIEPAPADLAALAATLSADEQARAARFHFQRDRQSYQAARHIAPIAGKLCGNGRR